MFALMIHESVEGIVCSTACTAYIVFRLMRYATISRHKQASQFLFKFTLISLCLLVNVHEAIALIAPDWILVGNHA
jgi:hypothetical protein